MRLMNSPSQRHAALSWRLKHPTLSFWLIFLAIQPAIAEDGRSNLGLGLLSLGGYIDVQFLHQFDTESHWLYGLRYFSGTETFEDPFNGNKLSDDTTTLYGLSAFYLLNNKANSTWYAGAAIYKHSLTVKSLITGESSTDSTVAPFIGGGYISRVGKNFYYNIGVLVSLGRQLKTETSVTQDESTGFDPQVIIGFHF